jgi:intraflagellar transport protein 74
MSLSRTKEVKKNIDIYEKKLRDLEGVLEDKKTEEEDKKKYEILYQKDREMDEFLNSFDKVRSNEISELTKLEKGIT